VAASHLVMLSVGYGTNDPSQTLPLQQARNYWYRWFMATPRGQLAVEHDRHAFARMMWDTWSPSGWYDEGAFDEACRGFGGPDWAQVVVHSYRHRWGFAAGDPAYDADEARLNPAPGARDRRAHADAARWCRYVQSSVHVERPRTFL
jgi:hypothetical protein